MSFQVVFLKSAEHDLKSLHGQIFDKDVWQASYAKIKDAVNTIGNISAWRKCSR